MLPVTFKIQTVCVQILKSSQNKTFTIPFSAVLEINKGICLIIILSLRSLSLTTVKTLFSKSW